MLVKTIAELNMARESGLYILVEFIGNPITAMFIAVFVAYYVLGIRQHMSMGTMLTHTENGFGSIANILLIIGAGGAFNAILKSSSLADTLAVILSNMHMHPILLAWLVALILHAAVGSATVAMMGATAIVAPMLPLYPDISPEIIAIAIGSGAIGCTIVTDSLFWLVKHIAALRSMKHLNTIRQRHLSLQSSLWRAHSCCHLSSKRKETYYGKR